jgi:hypothetical protein
MLVPYTDPPWNRSNAEVSNFNILPILDISFTTPDPTNMAQMLIAEANTSGAVSGPKLGVKAAAMGAWCCSNRRAPSKSGSGDALKCCA